MRLFGYGADEEPMPSHGAEIYEIQQIPNIEPKPFRPGRLVLVRYHSLAISSSTEANER
jgi:hypothetical protein